MSFRYGHPGFAVLCSVLFCGAAFADSDVDAGIDIALDHSHQVFADDSANVNTVDFAPYLQYGNWDFSLDAPWISADANYVNSQFPSRVVTACENLSQYASYAQKHPNGLVAKYLAACDTAGVVDSGDKISGFSDVTAFAHYGLFLDDRGIWLLSLGAGYKFDNGDVDKNLGSDTRNTLLEASIGASYGIFNGTVTGGYVFVGGGDELTTSHYDYAVLDLGVTPIAWLTVGGSVDYEQSYIETADDVTKVTGYVKFKPWQHVRLKVYARDYGNAYGYPEREYGGGMTLVY